MVKQVGIQTIISSEATEALLGVASSDVHLP